MPKKKINRVIHGPHLSREALRRSYKERYFNLFLNNIKCDEMTREEREYVLRKVWSKGAFCSFRISDETVLFAQFAPNLFNIYNFPTEVQLVNERGVNYFPSKMLKTGAMRLNVARGVEEPEVVLVYGQHSRQPIEPIVDEFIDRIVEVEMTIRTNLFAHKLPLLYAVMPENREDMQKIVDAVFNDDLAVAVGVDAIDNIKGSGQNIPYIIDKLYSYRTSIEAELQTFLGIDNTGIEKKERLVVDEVNASNELINGYRHSVLDCLNEGMDLTNEAFGTSYRFYANAPSVSSVKETSEQVPEGGDEDVVQ